MTPIDWTKPADEILTELKVVQSIKTGHKIRFNDVEEHFPGKGYRSIVAESVTKFAKVDAEANIVLIAASGPDGADLSDESSQGKILYIATTDNWPQELTTWVTNRCVHKAPRWQSEGFVTEPTLDEITFVQNRNLAIASTEQMINEKVDRINAAREARRAAIDDPTKTGAEIVAATVEAFG